MKVTQQEIDQKMRVRGLRIALSEVLGGYSHETAGAPSEAEALFVLQGMQTDIIVRKMHAGTYSRRQHETKEG